MTKNYLLANFLILICLSQARAQNFGSSYDFLLKETNARIGALGGANVSLKDGDPQLVFGNPATVNGKMAKTLGVTANPSFFNITQYNVAYADSLGKWGNFFGGIQYLNFGKMNQTDATGLVLGEFSASQYAVSIGTARKKGNFHLGASLKGIGMQIGAYQSFATAIDLGVHFQHPTKALQIGLAIKNLGFNIKSFYGNQKMTLPLNIQGGISYKLQHMPLRISATAFYIQETDIQYLDPNAPGTVDANGQITKPEKKISEQIFRHLAGGGEFLLHRNFNILFGYNHLRRKELKPITGAGLSGFTLGCAIVTKNLRIGYSYAGWHPQLGQHFFSLNYNMQNWFTQNNP